MPLTVHEGYEVFMQRLIPLQSYRTAASRHRASVDASLSRAFAGSFTRETGSFSHGTGVRNISDVDLLVNIKGGRPVTSDTALLKVKSALQASFPYTTVRISRPAVVVEFNKGAETWEIIPGYMTLRGGSGQYVWDIPGAAGGWMDTAPLGHLSYVNECNNGTGRPAGGAKKLARLAKAWKYYNGVPISSFYLEMRAAQHMKTQSIFSPIYDVCWLMEKLNAHSLADMNDPTGAASRFSACSSSATKLTAQSQVRTAATRARKVLDAYDASNPLLAYYYLNLLFGERFPSR